MRILMIAPEPFFEPRGTPFSEYHRIRALADLGHTVDLVTYPFGQDVALPGLRIFRCMRPPLLTHVRIGPSLAKIPLDTALAATAIRRAFKEHYDAIHSHEEGGFIGVILAGMLGLPHLYDMHSSLPQQLANFEFSRSRVLEWLFSKMERFVIRRSRVVITICPHLDETVRHIEPSAFSIVIENAPGSDETLMPGAGGRIRHELGLAATTPIVLYTGTFEAYQGLDLLLTAARHVIDERPDVRFVLVGGQPEQIEQTRGKARAEGVEQAMLFVGQRPAKQIPQYLDAADVLVSPRSTGTNTPLKIYQYLRSGKPIVATRLLTHTQVLDDEVAVLTDADAMGFAKGILRVVNDTAIGRQIGQRAKHLAETKYSYSAYLERTRQACERLWGNSTPQVAGGVA